MKAWLYLIVAMIAGAQVALCGTVDMPAVTESAREIPVANRVDVVVVGGSTGAVAAAVAAAEKGAKVFLAAPYPYLGEDMTATLRLWLEEGEKPESPLAKTLFAAGNPARPLHVKRALDEALLAAGVEFLYCSYATDVLQNEKGWPCGIVMANRAGRQAVIAKVIIDATEHATVARLSGARLFPFPAGMQTFKRVVIGGGPREGENTTFRKIGPGFEAEGKKYDIIEYTLRLPMEDDSCASWARAEQLARDMTFHKDQEFASDSLFHVPPSPMLGGTFGHHYGPVDVWFYRPQSVARLLVLSGYADIPRAEAEKLLRPLALIDMGARLGAVAADEAKEVAMPESVSVRKEPTRATATGEVREVLVGLRPTQQLPAIHQDARPIPVLGTCDAVVVGGGTSGAAAGIAAARQGAKTLVVEYLHELGGVGTLGAISKYYWGNRVGFTKEVAGGESWRIEEKAEWWRTTLCKAGAEIWFGTLGCGALVKDNRVIGAVVATPQGRGVILAKIVIDATGNADIAASAGAECLYTDASDIAVQGAGLPPRELGASYTNTDFTIVDETDIVDITNVFVYAKTKYTPTSFDMGKLIDTRERRRIVGDFTVNILDQLIKRTYPDTIVQSHTNYDTHGYTIHPYFALSHPEPLYPYMPYRCLLPKGLDGIIVTGLGVSAHRDAIPFIRMQPDIQNQGYAAGVAAAMAGRADVGTREINVRVLQKHLVEIGNLPESVLTDEDSYPMPTEKIEEAVESAKDNYRGVEVILAHPGQGGVLLREAYAKVQSPQDKLTYAHILGIMGDDAGLDILIAAVEAVPEWDKGWNFKSQGQFGSNMSRLDSLILALGRTGNRRATPAILEKVKLLDADKDFSHHRAVALALESLADPAAARVLAELLAKPNMSGRAIQSVEQAKRRHTESPDGLNALQPRRESLREIMLARALFRCGDKDDIGRKILTEYEKDLRGHFARHAQAVLKAPPK
ncbi:MAG: FAD-dependent oxidoreductase [bacterium]|nr:FAD-dependent oxidoreductase [bacterium]